MMDILIKNLKKISNL